MRPLIAASLTACIIVPDCGVGNDVVKLATVNGAVLATVPMLNVDGDAVIIFVVTPVNGFIVFNVSPEYISEISCPCALTEITQNKM